MSVRLFVCVGVGMCGDLCMYVCENVSMCACRCVSLGVCVRIGV